MKILIIEDEQSSAIRLKRMLENIDVAHHIEHIAGSNAEALAFFSSSDARIDLILSDIQLGDGLSFQSLSHAPADVPVIFTTAYDQYAVQAFKFNSIAYLLKPVDEDELRAALRKLRSSRQDTAATTTDAITRLLESAGGHAIRYRERFLIPHNADEYKIIATHEVSHIAIKDGVTRLCTMGGDTYTIGLTLDEAETQLDPNRFMRVNRQFIVNASAVEKLSNWFLGKMRIHMKSCPDEDITVSKGKAAAVKRWLDS